MKLLTLFSAHGSPASPAGAGRTRQGQSWGRAGAELGQSWGRAGAELGQSWGRAGAELGQSWGRAGAELGQSWGRAGAELGQSWGRAGAELGQSWGRATAEPRQKVRKKVGLDKFRMGIRSVGNADGIKLLRAEGRGLSTLLANAVS